MEEGNPQEKKKENTEYLEHTKKYTDLLDGFIKNTKSATVLKNELKIAFFVIIVLIMFILAGLFVYSIYKAFDIIKSLETPKNDATESIIGAVISIIPSLATMLVSLIKLPEIIAQYLFNLEEDKNMVAIIEKIQNYDIQMYSLENDVEHLLMRNQNKANSNDKPVQELSDIKGEPSDDIVSNDTNHNSFNNDKEQDS